MNTASYQKPLYNVFSLIILIMSVFGGAPAALAQTPAPFGNRDVTAPISLDNAYMLPGIYATKLEISQDGTTLKGTFTAWNNEDVILGGLNYTVQILGTDLALFDIYPVREAFTLHAKEKRQMNFSYQLRSLPAGTYNTRIQIVTNDGRELGWADAPFTVTKNNTQFVRVTPVSIDSPEFPGQTLDPKEGPNVSPSASFGLRAVLQNTGNTALTITPTLDIYPFNIALGNGTAVTSPSITLQPKQRLPFVFPITSTTKPGVYFGYLNLKDAQGKVISSLAEYRWVVRGASADVLPLRVSHLAVNKGDQTEFRLDFVGAPDAETKVTGTLRVELTDDKGSLGTTSSSDLQLTDAITMSNAHITLPRNVKGNPTIRTIITAENGQVLHDRSTTFTLSAEEIASQTQPSLFDYSVPKLIGAAIATGLVVCLVFVVIKNKHTNRLTKIKA